MSTLLTSQGRNRPPAGAPSRHRRATVGAEPQPATTSVPVRGRCAGGDRQRATSVRDGCRCLGRRARYAPVVARVRFLWVSSSIPGDHGPVTRPRPRDRNAQLPLGRPPIPGATHRNRKEGTPRFARCPRIYAQMNVGGDDAHPREARERRAGLVRESEGPSASTPRAPSPARTATGRDRAEVRGLVQAVADAVEPRR